MNDRYLFRAKRIDNGEWVCGSCVYTFCEDKNGIVVGVKVEKHWIVEESGNMVCVDEDTVCQCTGLRDKNGKLIWENDVVDLHGEGSGYGKTETVSYIDGGFYPFLCFGWECTPEPEYTEVIGNIFDNPELMYE